MNVPRTISENSGRARLRPSRWWMDRGSAGASPSRIGSALTVAALLQSAVKAQSVTDSTTQTFQTTELDLPESTIGILLLLGGIQLIFIGLIGEYLSRILDEVKGRTAFVIQRRISKKKRSRAAKFPNLKVA